jgi:prepilin-type N-terminal cleavage/methylation domain-containing protein
MKALRALATARAQGGFTMAEMLVTSAVIALVMGGLMSLMMTGTQSWVVGANRSEAQQSARLVLHRLSEEIRIGGWDPRNTATFPAIQALAPPQTGFIISNDWSADGTIQNNTLTLVNGTNRGEQITYDFVTPTLQRQESRVDTSPVTVTNAISGITFTYLNADDQAVASPHLAANAPNIRTVEITVTTIPDSQVSSSAQRVSVTSTIRARVRNR